MLDVLVMTVCSECQLVFTVQYSIEEVVLHYEEHIDELNTQLSNRRSHTIE